MIARPLVASALLSIAFVSSCRPGPCIDGLKGGRRYRLTILEPYGTGSKMAQYDPKKDRLFGLSCGFGWGLDPGTNIVFKAKEIDTYVPCGMWRVEPEPFDGVELGAGAAGMEAMDDSLAYFSNHSRIRGCKVTMNIMIRVPDHGDPFRSPDPSTLPPSLVFRVMGNESSDPVACTLPLTCADHWVGRLERL